MAIDLKLLNVVVLAEDYERMRDWYVETLGLELKQEWTKHYHYAELVRDGKFVVGIADTEEMCVEPHHPRRNSTVMQLCTDDIAALFLRVKEHGGEVQGPAYDKDGDFRFGSFSDPEGNNVWVIEGKDGTPPS